MSLIIPANSAAAAGGFSVDNSCRFNSASNDHLNRTQTAGNRRKFTFSTWVKRCNPATRMSLFLANRSGSNYDQFYLNEGGYLEADFYHSGTQIFRYKTNALYRDTSAWYHIILAVDTEHDTASSRVRIYVNGLEVTSFSTETNPSENVDTHVNENSIVAYIGSDYNSNEPDYYLAETVMLDGTQATPTDFGEFDEDSGIWKPIDVSGLTFGNNGFYLDFEDSSALGNDAAGSNNWTTNNLTAIDQTTDTPTNNFCTLSPLADSTSILSDGNCVNNADGSQTTSKGSIAVSNGRWYTECKITTSSQYPMLGIWSVETAAFQNPTNTSYPGQVTPSYGGYGNGSIYANGSNTGSQGYTWGNGNIIGIYLDLESATKTIKWYKDGSSIATLNLATTTDAFVFGDYNSANSLTASWNFGNPVFAISSGNTDANGYGNFEFSPTIGGVDYFAICTKNLAEYG